MKRQKQSELCGGRKKKEESNKPAVQNGKEEENEEKKMNDFSTRKSVCLCSVWKKQKERQITPRAELAYHLLIVV